jgi:hypothetical protein
LAPGKQTESVTRLHGRTLHIGCTGERVCYILTGVRLLEGWIEPMLTMCD